MNSFRQLLIYWYWASKCKNLKQFAALLGVSYSTMQKWYYGIRTPDRFKQELIIEKINKIIIKKEP